MALFTERIGSVGYGGDYNPEQWPREVWDEDVRLMREGGVNLVTLGVFAWASIEPRRGEFDFGWMDEIMDLLHTNGISVNLATPTASPPVWLAQEFPETLPIMADGNTYGFGNRMHYDPSSPIYRKYAAIVTEKLAERYVKHPALAMWHIGNEFGMTTFNDAASVRFRAWVEAKYTTIDAVNEAWTTRFWGQVYTDFAQIDVPAHPRAWVNPGRNFDFKRFTSDMLLECYIAERDIVHRITPDIPVATNFMRFYRTADYWKWAEEEDVVALDIYPNPEEGDSHVTAAFNFDLMRSLRQGQPWLVMEQGASAVSQWSRNMAKKPGRMRLGSYQAMAHGADAVMFFQWRTSVGGSERFLTGMVPHSGTDARSWKDVVNLGNELSLLTPVIGARSTARVAIVFDWANWWALGLGNLPVSDLDLREIVMRHYAPVWAANIPIDVVSTHSDLTSYAVVIVPNAYSIDAGGSGNLQAFATAGGHLLLSYFSGVVDGNNRVLPNGFPGAFRELIGAHIREYQPAAEGEVVSLHWSEDGAAQLADHWREDIHLENATAIATYSGGDVDGQPAIISNVVGDGTVTYLSTRLDDAGYTRLIAKVLADAGVTAEFDAVPPGVEIVRRSSGGKRWVFVLNHGSDPVRWDAAPHGRDLLTGAEIPGTVSLDSAGIVIIQES